MPDSTDAASRHPVAASHRSATWLERFCELVFVTAITSVMRMLAVHLDRARDRHLAIPGARSSTTCRSVRRTSVPVGATLLVASLLASALPSSASAAEPRVIPRWAERAARAQSFAERRSGRVGWVVLNHRGVAVAGWRMHRTFQSASVFKAMLAVCYLNDPSVRGRALSSSERSRLGAMITRSNDPAANWAYGRVRRSCLYRLARNVGMRGFVTSSHWGRTQITPYGTANLFFRLDRRIAVRHRALAMRWFRGVVPHQRWGLARERIVPEGMAISFKGGFAWSWGGGHTVSQGALLSAPNGHRLGLAVLTNHSPSQAYGEETIEGIGLRLLHGYRPLPAARG